MENFSPPVTVSTVKTSNEEQNVHIVREDLLPGGTKQRAIVPYLSDLIQEGYDEFVYASPFCGFAQVALAHAAGILNQKVTLFCEHAPCVNSDALPRLHELSIYAQSLGAEIVMCSSLADAEAKAKMYVRGKERTYLLPLGFNHPDFLRHYAKALETQFGVLCAVLNFMPKAIWLPVGSGTLTRVFRRVIPLKIKLKCVDVRVLKPSDARIQDITSLANTVLYRAEMPFHQRSGDVPPVPSNLFYDAKLWSFINAHARMDDIWWNVAR